MATRTITMTDRPPIRIDEANWPIIAEDEIRDWEGQYAYQSFRHWNTGIVVRQHTDGRAVVYGRAEHRTRYPGEREYMERAGVLVERAGIIDAIKLVANILAENAPAQADAAQRAARACIGRLPAEEIS